MSCWVVVPGCRLIVAVALSVSVAACADEEGSADEQGADTQADGSDGGGSEGPVDAGPFSLVMPDGWLYDESGPAPFTDNPPDPIDCDVGWGLEDGVFEVDSALCNWGLFTQPAMVDIGAGDLVEVILLHDTLFSEDPDAKAHLGAALADAMVWETEIMFPTGPGFLRPTWTADADYPAGTPVRLHIHNHGYNNYRVVDITVTRQ